MILANSNSSCVRLVSLRFAAMALNVSAEGKKLISWNGFSSIWEIPDFELSRAGLLELRRLGFLPLSCSLRLPNSSLARFCFRRGFLGRDESEPGASPGALAPSSPHAGPKSVSSNEERSGFSPRLSSSCGLEAILIGIKSINAQRLLYGAFNFKNDEGFFFQGWNFLGFDTTKCHDDGFSRIVGKLCHSSSGGGIGRRARLRI